MMRDRKYELNYYHIVIFQRKHDAVTKQTVEKQSTNYPVNAGNVALEMECKDSGDD